MFADFAGNQSVKEAIASFRFQKNGRSDSKKEQVIYLVFYKILSMAFPIRQCVIFSKRSVVILLILAFLWFAMRMFRQQFSGNDSGTIDALNENMIDDITFKNIARDRFFLLKREFENSQKTAHDKGTLPSGTIKIKNNQNEQATKNLAFGEGKSMIKVQNHKLGNQGLEIDKGVKKDGVNFHGSKMEVKAKSGLQRNKPCANVHAFYYPWYGSPKIDGHYSHWNHQVLPHWNKEIDKIYPKFVHKPPNDIASDFYPELGAYSSRDPEVIDEHFSQMLIARIGVIVVSYYPAGTADENGKPWDDTYKLLLDKAAEHGIKVTFHIEPYKGRNEMTVRDDIIHIIDTYGKHKGFYRYTINNHRYVPFFYVYDSYLTKQDDWAKVLKPGGPNTIRGTKYDSVMIGLLVDMPHSSYASIGGFDGLYTYFASNGFTYGSRWNNWMEISSRSREMSYLFIPSVGPGYIDVNIRPWNSENTRDRSAGGYYRNSWKSALEVSPPIVSITSFNEWHEGTQIEKAKPKSYQFRNYRDYKPFSSDYYLQLTKSFVDKYPRCN